MGQCERVGLAGCERAGVAANCSCEEVCQCPLSPLGCEFESQVSKTLSLVKIIFSYCISLIRPRADYQSNYSRSNQGREQIKGKPYLFQVHLKLKMKIPLSQLMSGNVPLPSN